MYTRRHSRGRLGSFEGLGVSRTLGNQFGEERQTAAQRGKEVVGGFTQFISAVLPHGVDAYKIHQGIPLGPKTPAGGVSPTASASGSGLPLIIGLGALGVVAFMFLGKKK